jgi:L-fuculose-phosphate aldolase
MLMEKERQDIIYYSQKMAESGLTKGTGGNISVYDRELGYVAITPSAVDYDELQPEDIAIVKLDGTQVEGDYLPSSEKDMHLLCYKKRDDIQAVVHTHSLYAIIMACLHEEIPPVHYLIGFAKGRVKCIPYYPFGSMELAIAASEGLEDKNAVLLGNHGLLAVGGDVKHAYSVAEIIEFVAEIYYKTSLKGAPQILSDDDMEEVYRRFDAYRKSKPSP